MIENVKNVLRQYFLDRIDSEATIFHKSIIRALEFLFLPKCEFRREKVTRFVDNPLIVPESNQSLGENINGPSLIEVPEWVENKLGRFYLYFAHHKGKYIRMAYSDSIDGPWKIYEPGVMRLNDAPGFIDHVASPDVHVIHQKRCIRMYFHGPRPTLDCQQTGIAHSNDGLHFLAEDRALGKFYFRVWQHWGMYYALAKDNVNTP